MEHPTGLKWVPKAKSKPTSSDQDEQEEEETKERCYHLCSIGWKQQAFSVWEVLLEDVGLQREQCVIVNVEGFPNVDGREDCRMHIGTHQAIWQQLASNEDVLRKCLLDVVRKLRKRISRHEPEVYIVFECKWGKHRSVAMAEMLARVLGNDYMCCIHHFSRKYWSRSRCGWVSCDCSKMTHIKEAALLRVEAMFLECLTQA